MDPDETLAQIRNRVAEISNSKYLDTGKTEDAAVELVQLFDALDNWIARGGFLPQAWTGPRQLGRRRRTQDGPTLEGVSHGKRSTYNQGCRCLPCTVSNRTGIDT